MSHQKTRRAPEIASQDDFEILEVVGVDENGVPIAAEDPNDVEVIFEEAPADLPPLPAPSEDAELRERLVRLQADFENFKKRIERERFDHFRFATVGLVTRLLPVLDNFDRAMAAVQQQGAPAQALAEGIALIQRQLTTELEAEGLRPIDSVGETFDPELHEAVATDANAPVPAHTVTQVFQRGYFLHERVLRPAMVRVRVDESEGSSAPRKRKES